MRALVTGAAGFIGSNLTRSLLQDGHSVVGIDCFTDNYGESIKRENVDALRSWDAFALAEVDLSEVPLSGYLDEVDVVFHLAGTPGVRTSWGNGFDEYTRNNIIGTQRLLEASKARPERRFVYASSSSVYGQAETFPTAETALPRPLSPYGVTKLAAEHLCGLYHANYGVDTVSLRYFSVFGPRQRPDMAFQRFFTAARAGEPITVYGDGLQTRDFTFVGDIVAATRSAGATDGVGGRVYNIGGGVRARLADAISIINDLVGRPLEVNYVETQHGDVRDTAADTTRAHAELGFAPATDLAGGLSAQFQQ